MPIPHRKRVRFDINPLVEVIFQARFPRLLEVEADLPVKFHSAIRDQFPTFNAGKMVEFSVTPTQGPLSAPSEMRHYEMASADGRWKVVLTSEFIALTTANYIDWVEFRSKGEFVVNAFLQHYRPAFFGRIGLRYRDAIARKALGLSGVPWKELIAPHIAGIMATASLEDSEVLGVRSVFALKLRDDLQVQVQHGLIEGRDGDEEYVIDSDFHTEAQVEAKTDAAISVLDGFRPLPNDLFQWCISDRLREAMGATEQDD